MKIQKSKDDLLLEMATLNPSKAGIPFEIWSEHNGISRNSKHFVPRVKVLIGGKTVSVSISDTPKILTDCTGIKLSDKQRLKYDIDYIKRNYDVFLRHWEDTDFSFDDEALFSMLRNRGEYR